MRLREFLLAVLLLAPPRLAFAAAGPATATVQKANATLTGLLRERPASGSTEEKRQAAELTVKLQSFLDVSELGRRALSNHWQTLDSEQRTEFTRLLRGIVEATYLRALRSQLGYEVRYLDETSQGSSLVVATEVSITHKERRQLVRVDYVLHRIDGEWRVFDLVTDGVGLVENYRGQFNKIIAKEGIGGLLARMKKKLNS